MARKKQGRQGQARRERSMARGGAKRSAAKSARRSAHRARTLGPAAKALAEDHRRVEALFGSYVASPDEAEKQKLVEEICTALIVHTAIDTSGLNSPLDPAHTETRLTVMERYWKEYRGRS